MADSGATKIASPEKNDSLCSRKQIVADKLQKREDERLADMERRREEKSNVTSAEESADFFNEQFAQGKNDLERELSLCDSEPVAKNKLVEKFDSISVMHQKLQKFLTESTMFLTSHAVRKAQDTLATLQTKIQEKRDEMIPKKKFAFKSKKKGNVTNDKPVDVPVKKPTDDENVELADCKVTDLNNQKIEMKDDINQKDVALARLDSCTIKLFGAPSAIHINKLSNCKIFGGPVSGSIFIRECTNCVFVVSCQQLRIHTTKDSQFYIHVTSRAIIEDCSTVSFGPYTLKYTELDRHYELSGLDRNRNSWDDIDDFNWLSADTPSPNWSLIPEEERIADWNNI